MLKKLLFFFIMLLIAFTLVVIGSSRTAIKCSSENFNWTCNIYQNNILQSSEIPQKVIRFYNNLNPALQCQFAEHVSNDSKNYYLIRPTDAHTNYDIEHKSFNSYASKALCEIDKTIINSYFTSRDKKEFQYTSHLDLLSYLWYLLAIICVLFGFVILFTKEDNRNFQDLSEEDKQKLYEIADKFNSTINNLTNNLANTDSNLANQINKYGGDITKITNIVKDIKIDGNKE